MIVTELATQGIKETAKRLLKTDHSRWSEKKLTKWKVWNGVVIALGFAVRGFCSCLTVSCG